MIVSWSGYWRLGSIFAGRPGGNPIMNWRRGLPLPLAHVDGRPASHYIIA
jgi:hypothetical protein